MRLVVNGEARESAARTLADLWRQEVDGVDAPGTPRGYAIALNGRVVRAVDWEGTALGEDDRVEIVRAVQGG